MLELIDLDKRIPKETYDQVFPGLEIRLGECQRAARAAGVPVIVVFAGWGAAGKGTLINRLAQALDPRGFKVHTPNGPTPDELYRPWMWRYWTLLPEAGSFAIFDRSWYGRVMANRVQGRSSRDECARACSDIRQFERQLADDGAVIVKFWLHISNREQKRRFRRLEKDPATAWKVGKAEWRQHRRYKKWLGVVEETLQQTETARAPWTIVEATHQRYARVKVFETLINAVDGELDRRRRRPKAKPRAAPGPPPSPTSVPTLLDRVDLTLSMDRQEYKRQLDKLQDRLFELEHRLYLARIPAAIIYQGWDAAGKGGNIKRLTMGLDPRGYEVIPIGAPTAEEKAHHYLWRFWKNVPKAGHIAIFDRSWYGRVLDERIEGFCNEDEWKRAFEEINEFERQLVDFGTVLVKFWLHIDRDEQLRRFRDREQTPHKQWKITDEDWRNRKKWKQTEIAVIDMLQRTSTTYAPWTILEANCKHYARVKALRTVADALENALQRR